MINKLEIAIYEGLVRLLYEEFTEGGEEFEGAESFTIEKRTIIRMPDEQDDFIHGYELFITKIDGLSYIGVHRLFYEEYGGRKGTVDGLIRFDPRYKYLSIQILPDKIAAFINDEYWA